MIIDIHNHADYHGYSAERIVENMDKYGIDVTCLLSWEAPKNDYNPLTKRYFSPFSDMPVPFLRCVEYKKAAPDRFILGFCPDPREPDAIERLRAVVELYDISICGELKLRMMYDNPDAIRIPKVEYKEDILVGYRWHDTKKIPARYPFGHGLSYTTFAYGKPALSAKAMTDGEQLTLTLSVTNTGSREGKEVVQLYIGDDKASVVRPVKELKEFQKIALAPGETRQVTFTITTDDLKYYDEATHAWKAEAGKFTAYVGSSSTDIRAKVKFDYQ